MTSDFAHVDGELNRFLPNIGDAAMPVLSPEGMPLRTRRELQDATVRVFRDAALDRPERHVQLNTACLVLSLGSVMAPYRVRSAQPVQVISVRAPAELWRRGVNPALDAVDERMALRQLSQPQPGNVTPANCCWLMTFAYAAHPPVSVQCPGRTSGRRPDTRARRPASTVCLRRPRGQPGRLLLPEVRRAVQVVRRTMVLSGADIDFAVGVAECPCTPITLEERAAGTLRSSAGASSAPPGSAVPVDSDPQ